MLRAVPGAQREGVAVTPTWSQQMSTKQDPLLVRGSAAEAPSVTRRWKSRAGLGSVSWATSLGCPEGCLAPPTSEPLTGDHQPLVSTAPVSGSSFPASEPLMSPAHRYLSLRSQSDAASSGTPSRVPQGWGLCPGAFSPSPWVMRNPGDRKGGPLPHCVPRAQNKAGLRKPELRE